MAGIERLVQVRPKQEIVPDKKVRFLLIGLWNSIFGLLTFSLLVVLIGEEGHQIALLFSYLVSVIHAHATQRRFVWNSKSNYIRELSRFTYSYILIYILNATLLWLSVDLFDRNALQSQFLLVAILTTGSYLMNKKFVFADSERIE